MRLRPCHGRTCAVLLLAVTAGAPAFAQNAFITNTADDTVSIIDVPSGTVITISADTGGVDLPITISLCETAPSTGQCFAAPSSTVAMHDAAGATPTFSVFVTDTGRIALNPAKSRIFVRFLDSNGLSHGSASVAVETD
jgi:hypothetical protein